MGHTASPASLSQQCACPDRMLSPDPTVYELHFTVKPSTHIEGWEVHILLACCEAISYDLTVSLGDSLRRNFFLILVPEVV